MDQIEIRRGRNIAMSDEVDARLNEIARRETMRRRGRVSRADLIEEWVRNYPLPGWQPKPADPAQAAA